MKIKSESDLKKIGDKARETLVSSAARIHVGTSTCGLAKQAHLVKEALEEEIKKQKLKAQVVEVGCNGMCHQEPIVEVVQKGKPKITYGAMTPDQVAPLVKAITKGTILKDAVLYRTDEDTNLINNEPVRYASDKSAQPLKEITEYHEHPFYQKQQKIALRNAGLIDPTSIEEYISLGGIED